MVVHGVAGNGDARLKNALNTTGIPTLGTEHPSISECYLREAFAEAIDSDTVRVRLVYADPANMQGSQSLDTIEVGGSLSQIQTNLDIFNNTITVGYTYPLGYNLDDRLGTGSAADRTVETSKQVPVLLPEHSMTITRIEYENPSPRAIDYLGKVNVGAWNLAPSAAPRTWLCTAIVGRSNDAGLTWTVTYNFQYRADTWDTVVTFIDPNTGAPPPDLIVDTGITAWQMYATANFTNLALGL
jgi:hypothetical protein